MLFSGPIYPFNVNHSHLIVILMYFCLDNKLQTQTHFYLATPTHIDFHIHTHTKQTLKCVHKNVILDQKDREGGRRERKRERERERERERWIGRGRGKRLKQGKLIDENKDMRIYLFKK